MAEFKIKYNNPTEVSGLKVIEPTPIDDRLLIGSEDILKDLLTQPLTEEATNYVSSLYDGMIITISSSKKQYVWCESHAGVLPIGFTYPPYSNNVAGQDYSNKQFNFVLFDRITKVVVTYNDNADEGLFISANLLPYSVLKEMSTAMATMKSSTTGFLEIEHPDRIEFSSSGITLILDPKPEIGEQFRITIY